MMIDPATVFQSRVRQYRRLGYEMIEVDEQARRAKVCVPVVSSSGGVLRSSATSGRKAIYRLIEVDATGKVRDERVHG